MQATVAGGTTALVLPVEQQARGRSRLDSVDPRRGVVVIMALDHARDCFTDVPAVAPIPADGAGALSGVPLVRRVKARRREVWSSYL